MQVLCERSNAGNDVRCEVCGQGFVVHWTRMAPAQRATTRVRVIQTLRRQHMDERSGHHVHHEHRFTVSADPTHASSARAAALAAA